MVKEGEDKEMIIEPACLIDLTDFGKDENVQSPKKKNLKKSTLKGL